MLRGDSYHVFLLFHKRKFVVLKKRFILSFEKYKLMKTIKNILVPTDFSINSKAAFQYALTLAEDMEANINVVHVYSDYAPETPLADPSYISGGKTINEIKQSLKAFVGGELEGGGDVAVANKVKVKSEIYYGSPVKDIVEFSKSGDYDIIIMGTAGERDFSELMFGSVSTHVSQQAHCPVLMVPSSSRYKKISNLLYACDFDHKSFKHTALISDVAKGFDANVHLLFVKTEENERQDYLKDMEDMSRLFHSQAPNLKYDSHIIEEDDVVEGINVYGKKNEIDIVIAVTKYRNFWQRILHSSKTKELAIYSELPVLVIKAEE